MSRFRSFHIEIDSHDSPLWMTRLAIPLVCALPIWVFACLALGCFGVSFTSAALNGFILSTIYFSPALLLLVIPFCPIRKIIKGIAICLVFPVAVLGTICGLYTAGAAFWSLVTGVDGGQELISSEKLGSETIAVYRRSWPQADIEIEQVYSILPGIKWVRPIAESQRATGATLITIDPHHIQCHLDGVVSGKPGDDVIMSDR